MDGLRDISRLAALRSTLAAFALFFILPMGRRAMYAASHSAYYIAARAVIMRWISIDARDGGLIADRPI